jgi:hypothetical protein
MGCERLVYILDTGPLTNPSFVNIYFKAESCFFIPLKTFKVFNVDEI